MTMTDRDMRYNYRFRGGGGDEDLFHNLDECPSEFIRLILEGRKPMASFVLDLNDVSKKEFIEIAKGTGIDYQIQRNRWGVVVAIMYKKDKTLRDYYGNHKKLRHVPDSIMNKPLQDYVYSLNNEMMTYLEIGLCLGYSPDVIMMTGAPSHFIKSSNNTCRHCH